MSLLTQLLFGGINSYLFIAVAITTIFVVWMLFISRFLEPVPYLNKIDTLLFFAVILSWIAYFTKNIVTIITSNILYASAVAAILIIITVFIVRYKK